MFSLYNRLSKDRFSNLDSIANLVDDFWASYHTAVSADEDEDSYTLCMDAPGFQKKHLKICLKDGYLLIKGDNHDKRTLNKSIALPRDISTKKVTAKLKDGILNIKLYKKEEVKPREINIE